MDVGADGDEGGAGIHSEPVHMNFPSGLIMGLDTSCGVDSN
jgi:hypothetical protein